MSIISDSSLIDGFRNLSLSKSPEVLLCEELKRARDADTLVDLWETSKGFFNCRNLCTFLNRLYKVVQVRGDVAQLAPRQRAALNQVLQVAQEKIEQFDKDGVPILCNALRHLKPPGSTLFQELKSDLFRFDSKKLEELDGKALALLADAAVELESDPEALLTAICFELLNRNKLSQCKPEELAYLARAASFLKELPADFYSALSRHILENNVVSEFKPWHLAMLADGIRCMENETQTLLQAIADHCLKNPAETIKICSSADLGLLKNAFCGLYKRPRKLLQLIREELLSERIVKQKIGAPRALARFVESYCGLMVCPETVLKSVKEKLDIARLPPAELLLAYAGFANAQEVDHQYLATLRKALLLPKNLERLRARDLVHLGTYLPISAALMSQLSTSQRARLAQAAASDATPTTSCIRACFNGVTKATPRDIARFAFAFKRILPEEKEPLYRLICALDPAELKKFDARYGVMLAEAVPERCWLEHISLRELGFAELAKLAVLYPRAAQLDDACLDALSRLTPFDQGDWESLALASWSFAKGGAYHSKTINYLFRRLKKELPTIKEEATFELTMLSAWQISGDATLEKSIQAFQQQTTLEFTKAFKEKFLLLYLQLHEHRPELFSEEIMWLLHEMQQSRRSDV